MGFVRQFSRGAIKRLRNILTKSNWLVNKYNNIAIICIKIKSKLLEFFTFSLPILTPWYDIMECPNAVLCSTVIKLKTMTFNGN